MNNHTATALSAVLTPVARRVAAVLYLAMTLSSCSQISPVVEGAGSLAAEAAGDAGSLIGRFDGTQPHVVLAIDPGFATTAALVDQIDPLIQDVTTEGGTLEAYIIAGRSASGMSPIAFSAAAGHGNFEPNGSNGTAWEGEAETFRDAARADLVDAIDGGRSNPHRGADLFGALNTIVEKANQTQDSRQRVAVLITGGGVHAEGEQSMLEPELAVEDAAQFASDRRIVTADEDITVIVAGVGHMPGVDVEVNPRWIDAVVTTWDERCTLVGCARQGPSTLVNLVEKRR